MFGHFLIQNKKKRRKEIRGKKEINDRLINDIKIRNIWTLFN